MPCAVIQSQISVPSTVTARILNPPPGNTITAAPVLRPFGGNTVIVGTDTSNTACDVRPASASGVSAVNTLSGGHVTSAMSGAAPGQIGTCSSPAGGCHTPTRCTLPPGGGDGVAGEAGMAATVAGAASTEASGVAA